MTVNFASQPVSIPKRSVKTETQSCEQGGSGWPAHVTVAQSFS